VTTRRFLVAGRVQGVGFRWFVLQQARRLGLGGFARNCPDGTVEVVASGEYAAVAQLEHALKRGPDLADVSHVSREDMTAGEEFRKFDIRRS
jgi:acylphosphatase